MSKFLDKTGLDTLWAKIKSTFQTLGNLVTAWGSTPSDTKYPSEKLVKNYVDNKSWFKNTNNAGMQNSNAYYQCISASTNDFAGLVKLYDVTEFFNGTIVNQNERSVFFGDVSLIRDGGNAGCKYARVCAMIGYNNASSNIILQSDDDNAYPILVKEDFERLNVTGSIGAYVISNGVAVLDTARTRSRYFVVDCSTYSRMFINAGFYSPGSYSLNDVKAYIFANDSGTVLGNSESTNFDGYVDVPAGATKLYLHTNNGNSQVSVGPTTTSPKYFLAMRYVAGWPAGTIEYFGRFYTRVTASAAYSARPLLLTFVQNLAPTGTTYIPSGYVIEKSATYTTHSNVANKLANARKLKTKLDRTSDSTFDGSADQENIPVTGTLPVANGGTGKTSAKAAEYNLTTGKSEISDTTSGDDRVVFELASPSESNGVTRGFRKLSTIWTWIMGLLSSESGVNISGNAATATKATQDSDGNAINATYFKSSGNTTLVAGAATKIGTQNGADVKLTLPAHQDISGKMNTSASNATAPSSSGGDGATATLLNNLTDGNSDIATTDDGDNVLIATTDNGGTVTNKWYKRKLVKLIPWIIKKLGTRLVYDCGAGSTSGDDFDAALAAFNAGQWVIIRKDGIAYYCVGSYSGPGLRFKQIANDGSLLKVNTISWTRGSSPSDVTQIEASLSGHTHSQYLTASSITGKMDTNADNAASGALQNLTGQLTEGTSDFTDNTEIFTSYAGNNGFAESGHVNQPYRRKASSMLNYVANSGLAQLVQIYGNSAKKLEIGYATIADTGNSSEMKALVELTCVSQSSTSQPGSSILMLVSVSCSNTYRFAKATILENTFWDGRTRPVIVTKVVSNRMYVYVGLLANNGTSLVSFDYTYAKITRIGYVNNWYWEYEYTSDGTFDHIFYCDDSVKFVPTVNSNTIGTTAGISNNSPADACVTYWSAMQPGCIRIVYNQNGTEYTLLFSKSSDGKYGSILKWSYTDNYMRIIRIQNNSVLTGADWVKISAGYADSAGSLASSVSVGSANQPVYFNNGVPTACNWWVS